MNETDASTGDSTVVVTPSELGEYVQQDQCPRFAKLRNGDTGEEAARDWKEAFNALNPMLAEEGRAFEEGVYEDVREMAHDTIESWRDYDNQQENDDTLRDAVVDASQRPEGSAPTLLMQAHLAGQIGTFYVPGDADLIAIWPDAGDAVHIRVIDVKASFEEKTYHQIQTACYTILYDRVLDHESVPEQLSWEIDAGIVYRESTWDTLDSDTLPRFDPAPREADIKRLLRAGGTLESVYEADLADAEYQLDSVCQSCPYNESCFTRSVESKDIRLLGLTRGEQRAFRSEGLETIEDVAELADPLDDPRPYENDDPEIRSEHHALVATLTENHSLGDRLPRLAQKAQAMLGEITPDHPDAHGASYLPWIQGSGDGTLPEDDPLYDDDSLPIERGSLIRVYLNVQWDYLRDRVAVFSGRVDCSNYDGTPLTFGEMVSAEGLTDDEAEARDERRLLEDGFERMFDAIQHVAFMSGQQETAPIHLYFFGRQERDALMDGVKRHPSLESANAVRDLLGLRPGIDQSMVSIVQEEVQQRLVTKEVSTGLLPLLEYVSPYDDDEKFDYYADGWEYTDTDGNTVNLRQVFYHSLFDYSVPFEQNDDGIDLLLGQTDTEPDGYYASRGRFGAGIPLEYVWAAKGIDKFGTDWTADPQYQGIIDLFRWRDRSGTHRITTEDVQMLSKKFTHVLSHIERGISFRNTAVEKEPLELAALDSFSLGASTLATACKEYLDLEYDTSTRDVHALYRQPVRDRILNGESIAVEVENAEVEDGFMRATAHLIHDEFGFTDPQSVTMATRVKGGDDGTSGSWMLGTPLETDANATPTQVTNNPEQIEHAAPCTVDSINTRTGAVELTAFPNGGKKEHDYRTWHKRWTEDDDDADGFNTFVGEGQRLILDPQSDDMTAERSKRALEHAEQSTLYDLITSVLNGDTQTPTTDAFDQDALDEYVSDCATHADPAPNNEQRAFIANGDAQFNLLQGPPGTGKTSGALSHAVLARAFARSETGEQLRAIVTGASNKAVDELLEDVAGNLAKYNSATEDESLNDVMLVRFVGDPPANPHPNVTYINYHEDEVKMNRLEQRLTYAGDRQATLDESAESEPHVIVFTTPSRVEGYMSKNKVFSHRSDPFSMSPEVFDCFAMDEASMLSLPQFLLAGAFIGDDAQVLVGGDHRQMPPVQKHDWEREDRRTVEQVAPFLSTLDFFRLLRGDAVPGVEDDVLEQAPDATIPLTRLEETYRCHTTVAEFLRRWVYEQDAIDYQSDRTATIPPTTGPTDGITEVVRADNPLTLVLHDDTTSQQSNLVEAKLSAALVDALPDSESLGIVTPHNAQKGLLSTMCDPSAHVDTVERFQGGQRDIMIMSATVSDPDYQSAESDFLLNPNRLNVALSRMKKKLLVIAPRNLFNVLPSDIDEYNNSTIWKGLYHEVNADGPADWHGSLDAFTGTDTDAEETNVWVYGR
jgi:hypothetical protein